MMLSRTAIAVPARLGRRGAFLLAVGSAWVCYGAAILMAPTPAAQTQGLTVLTRNLDLYGWGWVWVTSGLVGMAHCAVRTVGRDQPGFTALVVPAAAWSAGYFVDWVAVGAYDRGWVVASTYAALAASIVIAAGWPEVRRHDC